MLFRVHTNIIDKPVLSSPLEDLAGCRVDFVDAFLACLKTDRADGMFTTVVCDEVFTLFSKFVSINM